MGEQIKGLFFTDRLRGIVSTVALILILGVSIGGWLFPKKSEVDAQTLQTLQSVAEQFKRSAAVFEQQSLNTVQLNETLKRQLTIQQENRDASYGVLLDRWGLDADGPPASIALFGRDGGPIDGVGVLPPDYDLGSRYLPTGAGSPSGDQHLSKPADGGEEKSVERTTGVPGGDVDPTRK